MEKKLILAIALSILVIVTFQRFTVRPPIQPEVGRIPEEPALPTATTSETRPTQYVPTKVPSEEKEFTIKKEEAYGEYRAELKQEIPRSALPEGPEPKAGMALIMQSPDGQQRPVKIVEVKAESLVLDMNHPLAGKNLIFKIKILKVE